LIVYPTLLLGELAEAKKISKLEYAVWNSDEIDNFVMMYNGAKFSSLGQADSESSDDQTPDNFELPQTWEQLESTLNELDAKLDLPLAEGWAGHTFISRVASNVRTRGSFSFLFDRSTMEPLVEQAPFIEALEYLKRTATKRSSELKAF